MGAPWTVFLSDPSKTRDFCIGNSKNTINFEVSDQQKRPNLVHSDSKPCFSALGRSPRPPAIDFLGLSGSRAPDPSQTSLQAVFSSNPFKNTRFWLSECIETLQVTRFPLPAAHRNASKRWPRLGFSRGLREQRPAPKPTFNRNLVKHEVSEATFLTTPPQNVVPREVCTVPCSQTGNKTNQLQR